MKRLFLILVSALALCVANAQMVAGGRATSQSLLEAGSAYLMLPAVQRELGLSDAVSKKISAKYMTAMRGMMSQQPQRDKPLDAKAQRASFETRLKKMKQAQQENLALLTPPQKARLKQITLQQAGAAGLLNPEVKKELKLTPPQEQRIGAIVRDGSMQMFAGMRGPGAPNRGGPPKREEMQKRMGEFAKKQEVWRAKMLAESIKSLKPDQQAKWKAMQGKPFKMDMMGGMPRMAPTALKM
jgi:hypothetical protein